MREKCNFLREKYKDTLYISKTIYLKVTFDLTLDRDNVIKE